MSVGELWFDCWRWPGLADDWLELERAVYLSLGMSRRALPIDLQRRRSSSLGSGREGDSLKANERIHYIIVDLRQEQDITWSS